MSIRHSPDFKMAEQSSFDESSADMSQSMVCVFPVEESFRSKTTEEQQRRVKDLLAPLLGGQSVTPNLPVCDYVTTGPWSDPTTHQTSMFDLAQPALPSTHESSRSVQVGRIKGGNIGLKYWLSRLFAMVPDARKSSTATPRLVAPDDALQIGVGWLRDLLQETSRLYAERMHLESAGILLGEKSLERMQMEHDVGEVLMRLCWSD